VQRRAQGMIGQRALVLGPSESLLDPSEHVIVLSTVVSNAASPV
jgi:hypothetical protein